MHVYNDYLYPYTITILSGAISVEIAERGGGV